jgi:hypothetical protein
VGNLSGLRQSFTHSQPNAFNELLIPFLCSCQRSFYTERATKNSLFFFSLVTGSTLLASVEAINLSVKESFSTPHGVVVNVSLFSYSTQPFSLADFQLSWVYLIFRIKSLALPVFRFGNMCLSDKELRYQTFNFRILSSYDPKHLLQCHCACRFYF